MAKGEYETQVMRPESGRGDALPRPAVRLGQRLAQLSNGQNTIDVRVIIISGTWFLVMPDGQSERLGND